MNAIARVAVSGAVLAVLGGFLLGRTVAGEASLPDVGEPVTVGSTADPTPSVPAPSLRPRDDRAPDQNQRPGDDRTDRPRDDHDPDRDPDRDNSGPGSLDDDGDDNSGPGGGGDDVPMVGPSPSHIDDDDDNSGQGGGDDDNSGPGGGDDSGGDDG